MKVAINGFGRIAKAKMIILGALFIFQAKIANASSSMEMNAFECELLHLNNKIARNFMGIQNNTPGLRVFVTTLHWIFLVLPILSVLALVVCSLIYLFNRKNIDKTSRIKRYIKYLMIMFCLSSVLLVVFSFFISPVLYGGIIQSEC